MIQYKIEDDPDQSDWQYSQVVNKYVDGKLVDTIAYDGEPEDNTLARNFRGLVEELNKLAELHNVASYDEEAKALYIDFNDNKIDKSIIHGPVVIDLDEYGVVVGVEVIL